MAHFKETTTMKRLIILLAIISFFSCNNKSDKTHSLKLGTDSQAVKEEFSKYLENFKKIDLPIVIKGCKINSSGLKKIDFNKFKKYTDEYSIAFAQIPTNGNFIATLTLAEADCYLPVLTTYDFNGQVIDRVTIAIGGCGSDCGFNCEEFMTLKEDYSFFTSDTISTYECDSLGHEVPNSYEYYVIYKKGKLLIDGKIEKTAEIKELLQGRKNEP